MVVLIYKHDAQILNLRIHNPSTEQSNQKCIVFLLNNSPFNTAKLIADICLANLVFHLHELHAFAAQAFGKLQPLLTLINILFHIFTISYIFRFINIFLYYTEINFLFDFNNENKC